MDPALLEEHLLNHAPDRPSLGQPPLAVEPGRGPRRPCQSSWSRSSDRSPRWFKYLADFRCLVLSASSLVILTFGLLLPLMQMLWPTGNLLATFIMAPKVTRTIVELRARRLQEDISDSYTNYCSIVSKSFSAESLDPRYDAHYRCPSMLVSLSAESIAADFQDEKKEEEGRDLVALDRGGQNSGPRCRTSWPTIASRRPDPSAGLGKRSQDGY